MQAKNETFRNFLIRTDALALKLGVNVQDLPPVIGVGRASLFCYRSGTRPISTKTWMKLENAERAAGIPPWMMNQFLGEPDWEKRGEILQGGSGEAAENLLHTLSLWKDVPADMVELLLNQYSSTVRRLLHLLWLEKEFNVSDEIKLEKERCFATAAKLQPLFDSWVFSRSEQAKPMPATEQEPQAK